MNEQQLREGLHRLAPHVEEVGVWEALHERRRRRAPRAAWAAAVLVIVLATLGFGMNAIVQHLSHHADVVVITDDTMSPGSTEPASTETVTTTLSGTSRTVTTRWPPGIEAVVLSSEKGLYVIDGQGVRWSQEREDADQPSTTATVRDPLIVSRLDGLVISSNNEFLAHIEDDEEIVVRSIADGSVVRRATVQNEGHTTLRAISPDGILAALVAVGPQAEADNGGDEVPWTVTVVDLSTGTATVEDVLAAFVQQRIEDPAYGRCGLATISWLPEHKLLIGMSGDSYETYLYDPVTDNLTLIPGLEYVWDSTSDGLVLGLGLGLSSATTGEAMIWEGSTGSNEPVILDPEWPYAGSGSLNADGSTAVLMVANSAEWEAGHGWQLFRRNNSEWRAAGSVAEVDWMNQPPILLSGDGNMAWTVVYQSTTENETVLLSHDFTTGSWEEWFGSEDMQIDLGTYYFAGIVPEG